MRVPSGSTIIAACALMLASCGPKTLELPQQPIDRAATCGAVAAANERAATADVKAPLSFDSIGRVIHYPLLAGSAGGHFSSDTAAAVQKRMSDLENRIVEGKWRDLIPACKAAFPATAIEKVTLPGDRFQAQLGCDELGNFLRTSLEGQDQYVNELGEYRDFGTKVEATLAAGLHSRAGSLARAQEERSKALAAIAEAGPPVAVMRECIARFG